MVVPIPIATPSTAAMIGLTLCASEYRNLVAFEARGTSVLVVPSLRKSSRSLPAVNTPEPPVMIMQRIAGLFCAVSMASLMARYMACEIAFFFSGRRSVITRVASSSVTIRCPVMIISLQQAAKVRLARLQVASYMIRNEAKEAAPIFHDRWPKDYAMQLTGIHHLTAI